MAEHEKAVTGREDDEHVSLELDDLVSRLEQANVWWLRECARREKLVQAIEAHREGATWTSEADERLYSVLDEVMRSLGMRDDWSQGTGDD